MKLCLQTKDNFYTSTTPNYAKGNSRLQLFRIESQRPRLIQSLIWFIDLQYMQELLKNGQNLEFFIEGGRTRTGKACTPKGGLLSVVVDAFMDGESRWKVTHDM